MFAAIFTHCRVFVTCEFYFQMKLCLKIPVAPIHVYLLLFTLTITTPLLLFDVNFKVTRNCADLEIEISKRCF